jgi:hypothetical protein
VKNAAVVKPRLTQVIAEREFRLVTEGGRRRKVHLRIGKPRPSPDGHGYSCVYQIDGLERGAVTWSVGGKDGVQALHLAMQLALVALVHDPAYAEGRLTLGDSPNLALGLPLDARTTALIRKVMKRKRPAIPPRRLARKRPRTRA